MKKITTLITLLVLCVYSMFAQSPEKFTYQAVVRNASNALVVNAPVGVRVSILQGSATGNPVYVETQTVTTNANGLLTMEIGGGNVQQGTFAGIDWANGPYFLKTETDPNGGSNYSITSTQQLLSVPYALYAKEAGNVPTNVGELTNDANYITLEDVPGIPSNVSAFTNDAGYLTGYTETDPQFNAWDKDYNDLINKPTIPTVPTNVSAFTNDAGYLTNYTETDPQFNAWDKDYNDLINKPVIPTVPTNVSSFTNDAGYITGYTETDPQFNAWDKDYNDLINKPNIPTVPTNVSAFTNDAGYITSADISEIPTVPTNVSAFTNDVGYLTNYTETDPNVPAWAKEATKPAYDYSEIANTPMIPAVPTNVSAFENDVPYLTSFTEQQVLSISNDTIFLTGGSFVKLPESFSGDYNDLTNKPEIPEIPEIPIVPDSVSAFTNDAGYITMDSVPTIPVEVSVFINDAKYVSNAECADVNLCTLANALSQLQALVENQQSRIEELESLIGVADTTTPPIDTTTVTYGVPCPNATTVTDIDGNTYNTVQIGDQCWMKENLRTTHYADGTAIPAGGSNTSATAPYYYNYTSSNFPLAQRGYLYNWPAAMHGATSSSSNPSNVQGVCPTGWHLPSDAEWTQLTDYVGSQSEYICDGSCIYIAKALVFAEGWDNSSTYCAVGNSQMTNNATGFSAVPAGHSNGAYFFFAGNNANFWSSSEYGSDLMYNRQLNYDLAYVLRQGCGKDIGFSVRCLRDGSGNTTLVPTVTTIDATSITDTSAILTGTISNPDNVTIIEKGFEWKTTEGGSYSQAIVYGTTMVYELTGLTESTDYTYRAFVTTETGINYGDEINFTTLDASYTNDSLTVRSCITPASHSAQTSDAYKNNGYNGANHGLETVNGNGAITSVTDYDGNEYPVVQIGSQCWLAVNMRCTHSPNTGTYIVNNQFESDSTLAVSTTGKMARWYNNDSITNSAKNYGLLYNWNAAMGIYDISYAELSINTNYDTAIVTFNGTRQGVCPVGWHVPSDAEWTEMETTVNGAGTDYNEFLRGLHAGKLSTGNEWEISSTLGSPGDYDDEMRNSSGFSVLPADACSDVFYGLIGYQACFWTSTQEYPQMAFTRALSYASAGVYRYNDWTYSGLSVRCLRDEEIGSNALITPTVQTHPTTNITANSATLNGEFFNPDNVIITSQGFEWKPADSGSYTQVVASGTTMAYDLTDLMANTEYTFRAFVITTNETIYGLDVSFITPSMPQSCLGFPTVKDIDGNTYNTVQIGQQCWMKENLRTTHYADGTAITGIPYGYGIYSNTTPYYYDHSSSDIDSELCGYFYNWPAVMHGAFSSDANPSGVQGVCPTGWHVPSDNEWTQLTDYVSSQSPYHCSNNSSNIAKALAFTSGWENTTEPCAVGNMQSFNNSTGFGILPMGYHSGGYYYYSHAARFWSTTEIGQQVRDYGLFHTDATVYRSASWKSAGNSLRCLRNTDGGSVSQTLPIVTTSTVTNITANSATLNGAISNPDDMTIDAQGFEWKVSDGSPYTSIAAIGTIMAYTLTNLPANTNFTFRAFAITSGETIYGTEMSFTTNVEGSPISCPGMPTVTDVDGNVYNTIQIGEQCWMKENLRTTKYADGTCISAGNTPSLTEPHYYNYFNMNIPASGNLYYYNWSAVMHGASSSMANPSGVQGICPNGWHVPSDAEWTQLTNFVSNQSQYCCSNNTNNIAKALADTIGWSTNSTTCAVGNVQGNNNATGFGALPAGYSTGNPYSIYSDSADFWSTTETSSGSVWIRYLSSYLATVRRESKTKDYGYSVRCLRD